MAFGIITIMNATLPVLVAAAAAEAAQQTRCLCSMVSTIDSQSRVLVRWVQSLVCPAWARLAHAQMCVYTNTHKYLYLCTIRHAAVRCIVRKWTQTIIKEWCKIYLYLYVVERILGVRARSAFYAELLLVCCIAAGLQLGELRARVHADDVLLFQMKVGVTFANSGSRGTVFIFVFACVFLPFRSCSAHNFQERTISDRTEFGTNFHQQHR